MKQIASLILFSLFISACSKVEKFEEKTDKLVESTDQVSETTQDLKSTTNYMVRLKRQSDAAQLRSEQFTILMSNTSGMGAKLTAASIMFKAFEYQLWDPNQNSFDSDKLREQMQFEGSNSPTQKDINNKLSAALKARAVLEKVGLSVKLDKDLTSILKNIQLSSQAKSNTEYRIFLAHLNALTR